MSNHVSHTVQDDSLFKNKTKGRKPRNIGPSGLGSSTSRIPKNSSTMTSSRKLSISSMTSDHSNASKASSTKLSSSVEDSEYENITITDIRRTKKSPRSMNSNFSASATNSGAIASLSDSPKLSLSNDFLQRMGFWLYSTIPKSRSRTKTVYSSDTIWMLGICYNFAEDGGDVNLSRFYPSARPKRASSIFNFNPWGDDQEPDQVSNNDDLLDDVKNPSASKKRSYSLNVFAPPLLAPTAVDIRPSISENASSSHGRLSPTLPQHIDSGSTMMHRLRAISLTNKRASDSTTSFFRAAPKSKQSPSNFTGMTLSSSPSQFSPLNDTFLPTSPQKRSSLDNTGKLSLVRSGPSTSEMVEVKRRPSTNRSLSSGSSVSTTKLKDSLTHQRPKRTEKGTGAVGEGFINVSSPRSLHSPVRIGKPASTSGGYEVAKTPNPIESESAVLVERPKAPPSIQVSLSNGSEWLDSSWVNGALEGANTSNRPHDVKSDNGNGDSFPYVQHTEPDSTPTWEKVMNPLDDMLATENDNESITDNDIGGETILLEGQDSSANLPPSSWMIGNPTQLFFEPTSANLEGSPPLCSDAPPVSTDGGADLDSIFQSGEKEGQLSRTPISDTSSDTISPQLPHPRLLNKNSSASLSGAGTPLSMFLQDQSVSVSLTPNQRKLLEFLSDFRSRVAFTYRKDFTRIEPSFYTSDFGWGCMHRCSQSLLCNALLIQALGRGWRRDDLSDPSRWELYCRIIIMFLDEPSSRSPFSIHNLALAGKRLGTNVGEWFGPTISAKAMRELVAHYNELDVSVYVSTDGVVYKNDVYKIAHRRRNARFGPVLVLVATRLGLDNLNPVYYSGVQACFEFAQCVGIVGGRPNSALYFVGVQGDELLCIDPHTTQPTLERKETTRYTEADFATFHIDTPQCVSISQLDPSMLAGFLIKDGADFENFCNKASEIATRFTPVFTIEYEAPVYSDNFGESLDHEE